MFLLFSLFISIGHSNTVSLDRISASVNKDVILYSDLREFRKLLPLRGQLDPLFQGTSLAQKGAAATDKEILQFLIDEKLITQQFQVSEAELDQEINAVQANNKISRQDLMAAVQNQGFSFADYSALVRLSLSKRTLIDREIRSKVFISEDDVKNHLVQNQGPETKNFYSYQIRIITLSESSTKSPKIAEQTLESTLKSIKAGEPFAELAKRVSDHPSAPHGGDLGDLSEHDLSQNLKDQVKKLKIGEVSNLFEFSPKVYALIKLDGIKTQESDQIKKLHEEIKSQLYLSEYRRQVQLWIERSRSNAFIHFSHD